MSSTKVGMGEDIGEGERETENIGGEKCALVNGVGHYMTKT